MKNKKVAFVLDNLALMHPNAHCELVFRSPFELLVAVILSAQCTDKRVNMVTEKLFAKYNTAQDFAKLSPEELEPYIYSTGFYKNKAKSIVEASRSLLEHYQGKVPDDLDALVSLRGVGRKTASVVLAVAFGKPAFPVDTHVFRVSKRIGLASGNSPEGVEQELKKVFDKDDWIVAHHLLIFHGRYTCTARSPKCAECKINDVCDYGQKILKGTAI